MSQIEDQKYSLALAVLNAMVGLCFTDVRAERSKSPPDADVVRRLQARFEDYYAQRECLACADAAALQAVINDIGPRVRGRVRSC